MIAFLTDILYGDLTQILGEELYAPTAAAVAAAWAILSFAGCIEIFKNLFAIILNYRSGRR